MALTMDLVVDEEFSNLQAVFKGIRPDWEWSDVRTKALTDGITNKITCFFLENDKQWTDAVLVRRYGENTDLVIDRKAERRNMVFLHSIGCGSPLYAVLNNALVYGFTPGKTTTMESIRDPALRVLVPKEMAKMHYSINISSQPGFDASGPSLFATLDSFLKVMPARLSDPAKEARWRADGRGSVEQLRREAEEMRRIVEGQFTSPLGFTHNDLLLANIIHDEAKTRVSFIDFEYGAYNYVFYDIGNHFVEYGGTDEVDHSRYPDDEYQRQWLTVYLTERNRLLGNGDTEVSAEELDKVLAEVNVMALCSHLLAAAWCVIQAENSKIDFDYLHFGIRRLDSYFQFKDKFTSLFLPLN